MDLNTGGPSSRGYSGYRGVASTAANIIFPYYGHRVHTGVAAIGERIADGGVHGAGDNTELLPNYREFFHCMPRKFLMPNSVLNSGLVFICILQPDLSSGQSPLTPFPPS